MSLLKKCFIALSIIILGIFTASAAWGIVNFNDFSTIISYKTFKKDSQYMYYSTIEGNYNMDEFIKSGGAWTIDDLDSFTAANTNRFFTPYVPEVSNQYHESTDVNFKDTNYYYGKNYLSNSNYSMIIRTNPYNGYSSVSTVNLKSVGILEELTISNKNIANAAAYMPTDGMNEKGLSVSLYFNDTIDEYKLTNTYRTDVTETVLVRMLLDNAANIDEALDVMDNLDVYLTTGNNITLVLTDETGRSVKVSSKIYDYLGVHHLVYITEEIEKENITSKNALNELSSFIPENSKYITNYNVIYDTTSKSASYYLFGESESRLTIKL